jgi:hypothetical protein
MLLKQTCLGTCAYMGGTPSILEEFSFSFLQMALYSNEYLTVPGRTYIHYDRSKVSYHAKARNELCQNMQGQWILMLDSDHLPEPDLLARMYRLFTKHHLDVLCGIYQIKRYPYPPLLYTYNEDFTDFVLLGSFDNPNKAEIFEIGAAGGGCLMISRQVIYRMLNELKERPFDITKQKDGKLPLSEDLSFFKRCHDLDIKCYAAANVECPHAIITPLTMQMSKVKESGMEMEKYFTEGLV